LNDPEEGGETDFPNINITVVPKRGRIVLWVSRLKIMKKLATEIFVRWTHLMSRLMAFALLLTCNVAKRV
jgi:hypothetical protein